MKKTNLICRCTATPTMITTTNCERTTATVHLDQTNHDTEGGAQPKQNKNEWCMKKIKEPTNEEVVNRGNFGILLKMLGVERLCMV